jgi:hypothetical protein
MLAAVAIFGLVALLVVMSIWFFCPTWSRPYAVFLALAVTSAWLASLVVWDLSRDQPVDRITVAIFVLSGLASVVLPLLIHRDLRRPSQNKRNVEQVPPDNP